MQELLLPIIRLATPYTLCAVHVMSQPSESSRPTQTASTTATTNEDPRPSTRQSLFSSACDSIVKTKEAALNGAVDVLAKLSESEATKVARDNGGQVSEMTDMSDGRR